MGKVEKIHSFDVQKTFFGIYLAMKKIAKKTIDPLIVQMKEKRKLRKISQLDIGNALGVTSNTITFWETGKNKPTRRSRARIANWLKGNDFVNLRMKLSAMAKNIKIMRLKRGLNLSKFSRSLGVGVTTVYNWENGISRPSELHTQSLREWQDDNPVLED